MINSEESMERWLSNEILCFSNLSALKDKIGMESNYELMLNCKRVPFNFTANNYINYGELMTYFKIKRANLERISTDWVLKAISDCSKNLIDSDLKVIRDHVY